jgi:bifunctional enzyme CysN/CysC
LLERQPFGCASQMMPISVVCLGAVDHGKSTLLGRLLYDAEQIGRERVEEIAQLARLYARRFEFAYFLDAFEEELRDERTLDTVRVPFRSQRTARDYDLIDVPGHRELLRPMLTGGAEAQIGVMVVSAAHGLCPQGTRHLGLARLLGVQGLVVAVNKMDVVSYAEAPFHAVRGEITRLAARLGWAEPCAVPLCALSGDNVQRRSQAMPWYTGPTLVEALDAIELPEPERALRFVAQCEHQVGGEWLVLGRVQSGVLRRGERLRWQPSGAVTRVAAIRTLAGELAEAPTGRCVALGLDARIARGQVGGPLAAPPVACVAVRAEIVAVGDGIEVGEPLELSCGTARVSCRVEAIETPIDAGSGARAAVAATCLREGDAAQVRVSSAPVALERHAELPGLGRFVLWRAHAPVGLGVVRERLG